MIGIKYYYLHMMTPIPVTILGCEVQAGLSLHEPSCDTPNVFTTKYLKISQSLDAKIIFLCHCRLFYACWTLFSFFFFPSLLICILIQFQPSLLF